MRYPRLRRALSPFRAATLASLAFNRLQPSAGCFEDEDDFQFSIPPPLTLVYSPARMSKAVLLVNLGSPDSTSVPDVRRYLREFLMDKRVLDVPWLTRFCVVQFAILPSRPANTAHAYQSIWTREGSPLIVTSKRVQE